MKPRQCAIVGYALAGMRFNGVSMCHTSDTFHVCYEVTSVNTAELRSTMRDSDQRNTGKSVDRGSVMEQSVAGVAEQSSIKKNKGKTAISSQKCRPIQSYEGPTLCEEGASFAGGAVIGSGEGSL